MRPKHHKFTLEDIADITGRNTGTIRMDIHRGKINPDDLLSVYRYIHEHRNR